MLTWNWLKSFSEGDFSTDSKLKFSVFDVSFVDSSFSYRMFKKETTKIRLRSELEMKKCPQNNMALIRHSIWRLQIAKFILLETSASKIWNYSKVLTTLIKNRLNLSLRFVNLRLSKLGRVGQAKIFKWTGSGRYDPNFKWAEIEVIFWSINTNYFCLRLAEESDWLVSSLGMRLSV